MTLLLTETHVALLCEDGILHPAACGSSLVLAQPQFQAFELCQCSQIVSEGEREGEPHLADGGHHV